MSLAQPRSKSIECHPLRYGTRIATLYEAEWMHIMATMAECGGNVSRAARALGLARQSLQRKLRRLPPMTLAQMEQLQQRAA
jgi:ActR/RegA family two-component response regulator